MGVRSDSLQTIEENIKKIRPEAKLIIVTKNQNVDDISKLLENKNYLFGENRVQEAVNKYTNLRGRYDFKLHMIGPLQSNKTEVALQTFDVIQSIDRKKIIDSITAAKKKMIEQKIKTKEFFIQVNIGDEPQKSGVAINDLSNLYDYCLEKKIPVKGLMCIPPNLKTPEFYFNKIFILRDNLDKKLKLSMGMSADYELALKMQTDYIRVGSLIFN